MKTSENKTVLRVINQQFKLIGLDITFDDIEEYEKEGKKKVFWFDKYKFNSEEDFLKWKTWAVSELSKASLEKKVDEIDMLWGFGYK